MTVVGKIVRALGTVRWKEQPIFFAHRLTELLSPDEVFRRLRCRILRFFGLKIAKTCKVGTSVSILNYGNLTVGEYSGLGNHSLLDCVRPIHIGRGCNIGFGACLITGTHQLLSDFQFSRPFDEENSKPITLHDFVWIGANATILPGVTVGRGSVVAAGAVVAEDVEESVLVAGVPAKKIKSLPKP